ncbi:hypothetical protein PACTADRAFT_932 [Pachysolen tannophilus NRRL Y-2460]|uniref:Protein DOM34 homolog n=1 Tax=Pachysolen tannophilus NRRL Y-2460 TaxID=669874 RepID=A0A1E4U375_PACTA|nr:hypothetical protein PACTADRAFT_932 [Pachysolen tannophilus NRRL Y-2460]
MKLIKQSFEKDSGGSVTLVAEDKEDLWSLYNLIQKDDVIDLKTVRNVKLGSKAGLGSSLKNSKSERKVVYLSIKIEDIEFNASDEVMRLRGKTTKQNDDVPLNSYHTAELEFNHSFTLYKDEWDQISFDIITKSCSIEEKAEVGAIIMEEGIAHICLLTDNMTVLRAKIEKSIPKKKRGDNSQYEKAYNKFLKMCNDTILRNFDLEKLKAVIIASPGFVASKLYEFIIKEAQSNTDKIVLANKSKFIVTHSSTGFLQGLEEILKNPDLQKKLSDTKFSREVIVMDNFVQILNVDDNRAYYGQKECEKAILQHPGSVKILLITDTLFRNDDIALRKYYINLTENVKKTGGEVIIFSSAHECGEQLDQLTGIAVILNYPVYDLDEDEDEDEEEEEE